MLFNSYGFLFGFLPVALAGFFALGRRSPLWASAWLTAASVFFYGWWNPAYVGLLLGSILFNYSVGYSLARTRRRPMHKGRKLVLVFGIAGNLVLLGYFKYANFFVSNLNLLLGGKRPTRPPVVSCWARAILLPFGAGTSDGETATSGILGRPP